MKLDILAFGAHPDDVELGCSGTLLKMIAQGKKVGVVDLTRGELGTRGTAEIRDREAAAAAELMGLAVRENLRFRDGFFCNDEAHQRAIVRVIRAYRPEVVLCNAPFDRHPDHGRGSSVVRDGAFLAGLRRVETERDGQVQEAWRPHKVFQYIQDHLLLPSFVVDVTDYIDGKMAALQAYGSQFYNPDRKEGEPQTYISSPNFMEQIRARAKDMGHLIGVRYGEGFIAERPLRVEDFHQHL
ncbi:MAG: bacillithiol biosynthesis deacetylase BshB1 [Bacteroidota bacterium]